jgi:hypothetical protein
MSHFKKFMDGILLGIFWMALVFETILMVFKQEDTGTILWLKVGGLFLVSLASFWILQRINFKKGFDVDNTKLEYLGCGISTTSILLFIIQTSNHPIW